jgi:cathepsin B
MQSYIILLAVVVVAANARVHRPMTWTNIEHQPKRYPMGVKEDEKIVRLRLPTKTIEERANIPVTFDGRIQWPKCANVIGNIRDQSQCGSCWAVAAASVYSDRRCIVTDGADQTSYSAEDTMTCCTGSCGDGCQGGYPSMAWQWYVDTGVVTGGNYTNKLGCQPYEIPPHATHGYPTPACVTSCQNSYKTHTYAADKHMAKSAYNVPFNVAQIQTEIMSKGSVEATFKVYEDFFNYKSGVYKHSLFSQFAGYHAVRMIGWGTENNANYWLVANSWNTDWGMDGYFKILRGTNECEIESGIVAGDVSA